MLFISFLLGVPILSTVEAFHNMDISIRVFMGAARAETALGATRTKAVLVASIANTVLWAAVT